VLLSALLLASASGAAAQQACSLVVEAGACAHAADALEPLTLSPQTALLPGASDWKWADDAWWGRDKALHFGASFLLTTNGQYVLVNKLEARECAALPVSIGGAFVVGVAKEVYDARRINGTGFSLRDLVWNAAGIGAASLLIAL
jgi:uncharacterized protein YfiM (DUF2279 family)